MNAAITRSVKEFKKLENLSLDAIWSLDDPLEQIIALSTHVSERCAYGDDIALLSPAEKVFFLVQELEMEVNNGGFSQYFFNSSGRFCLDAPAALREIGAAYTAQLVEQALGLFGADLPHDPDALAEALDERITDEIDEQLNELDNDFYEYKDDLGGLTYNYIMAHKNDFQ